MSTFNVYGVCICRDLFTMGGANNHKILRFLQGSSPIINFKYSSQPRMYISEEDFVGVDGFTRFQQECIINDYNASLPQYYDVKADYFVIDLCVLSYNLCKERYEDGTTRLFTATKWFQKAYNNGLRDFFRKNNIEIEFLDPMEYLSDNMIRESVRAEVEWIRDMGYDDEHIILIEVKRSSCYTKGGCLRFFEGKDRDRMNGRLDYAYSICRKEIPGCIFIPTPINAYCDAEHKWGLCDLHYCSEYYEYLLEAINTAIQEVEGEYTLAKTRLEIDRLYRKYNLLLTQKSQAFLRNSISLIDGKNLINDFGICDSFVACVSDKMSVIENEELVDAFMKSNKTLEEAVEFFKSDAKQNLNRPNGVALEERK